MTRKQALVAIVRAFTVIAVVVVAIPFLGVFFDDGGDSSGTSVTVDIGDLVVGEPRFFDITPTRPLIVLRPNDQQRRDLDTLTSHVWDGGAYAVNDTVFALWGLSTGEFGGCRLAHKPAAARNPDEAEPAGSWRGGYWAAGCEASYDYAGRALRSPDYAYSNYVAKSRALRAPRVASVEDGRLVVIVQSR